MTGDQDVSFVLCNSITSSMFIGFSLFFHNNWAKILYYSVKFEIHQPFMIDQVMCFVIEEFTLSMLGEVTPVDSRNPILSAQPVITLSCTVIREFVYARLG